MMPVFLFEGPAGSGKTTSVVGAIAAAASRGALAGDLRVLALTKMHGSRRRMHEKLQAQPALRNAFDCVVLDAFARQTVRRWRTLAAALSQRTDLEELTFDETCDLAGKLLERPNVATWMARRYGLVVVDELQDCHDGQLRVLRALSMVIPSYLAGDGFQDLSSTGENAAMTWARLDATVTELKTIFRTDVADILKAALALRDGTAVPSGTHCKILTAPKKEIAASFLARNLTWWWSPQPDIAILTPAGPTGSKFVRETFARLADKPFEKDVSASRNRVAGPQSAMHARWCEDHAISRAPLSAART
jgi:hypothetical protein